MALLLSIIFLAIEAIVLIVCLYYDAVGNSRVLSILGTIATLIAIVPTYLTMSVPAPTIFPVDGQVSVDGIIEIKSDIWLSKIYYTLDPYADPRKVGELYEGPIHLEGSATVSAKARFLGIWSEMQSAQMFFNEGEIVGIQRDGNTSPVAELVVTYTGGPLYAGDKVNRRDLLVEATTLDGQVIEVSDYDYTPISVKKGDNEVEIHYGETNAMIFVNAGDPRLESITVTPLVEELSEGDLIKREMFSVVARYSDGSAQETSDFEIRPNKAERIGDLSVEIEKDGIIKTVSLLVKEKEYGLVWVTELHTPDDYMITVDTTNWDPNNDIGIDGTRIEQGYKVKYDFMLSSLWGNERSPAKDVVSNQYFSVNQNVVEKSDPEDRFFNGFFVVERGTNGSVTTANIQILADDVVVYESGEINAASTNIPDFHVSLDGVSKINIRTNAHVCGRSFYIGIGWGTRK